MKRFEIITESDARVLDRGETVMLAPGPGFYATPSAGSKEVRIAYVLGIEPLKRAVQLLGLALSAYNQRN